MRLYFDDPLNMNFFGQVEEAGLPLTFHVAPRSGGCYGCIDEVGLPRLEIVLKTFPKLIFLAHSQPFWAEISTDDRSYLLLSAMLRRIPTGSRFDHKGPTISE